MEIFLACLMVVALYFWLRPKSKPDKKVPTLEDIQKKYPKRKSQEQIRAEKLKQRQDAYDRDLANRMRAKGMSPSTSNAKAYNAQYRKLLRMLNGDRATADRLISAYGIDRAISDLERDRRIN